MQQAKQHENIFFFVPCSRHVELFIFQYRKNCRQYCKLILKSWVNCSKSLFAFSFFSGGSREGAWMSLHGKWLCYSRAKNVSWKKLDYLSLNLHCWSIYQANNCQLLGLNYCCYSKLVTGVIAIYEILSTSQWISINATSTQLYQVT